MQLDVVSGYAYREIGTFEDVLEGFLNKFVFAALVGFGDAFDIL